MFLTFVNQNKGDFEYLDDFDDWSFLHLFSYLIYEMPLQMNLVERFLRIASKYVPDKFVEAWREELSKVAPVRKSKLVTRDKNMIREELIKLKKEENDENE